MPEITFRITYHHGEATSGRLDMHDAAVSLQGFARALTLSTHALLNDGAIRRRGTTIDGARLLLQPPEKGSFEQVVVLVLEEHPILGTLGLGVFTNAFWDFTKWSWGRAISRFSEPETELGKHIAHRIEPHIGEFEELLEVPLEQAHRPIRSDLNTTIALKRSHAEVIIQLDKETLKAVSHQTDSEFIQVLGNVTRFNVLSGNGRLYDDAEARTISFSVAPGLSRFERTLLTKSLTDLVNGGLEKITFTVAKVRSAKGILKKYIVHNVSN